MISSTPPSDLGSSILKRKAAALGSILSEIEIDRRYLIQSAEIQQFQRGIEMEYIRGEFHTQQMQLSNLIKYLKGAMNIQVMQARIQGVAWEEGNLPMHQTWLQIQQVEQMLQCLQVIQMQYMEARIQGVTFHQENLYDKIQQFWQRRQVQIANFSTEMEDWKRQIDQRILLDSETNSDGNRNNSSNTSSASVIMDCRELMDGINEEESKPQNDLVKTKSKLKGIQFIPIYTLY